MATQREFTKIALRFWRLKAEFIKRGFKTNRAISAVVSDVNEMNVHAMYRFMLYQNNIDKYCELMQRALDKIDEQ